MKRHQKKVFLVFLSLGFILAGCFSKSEKLPELTPVTGKVTLDGKPLEGAQISFQPDEGRSSNGVTDKEGHYEIYLKAGVRGAVMGKHKVKISVEENMNLPKGEKQIFIPAKYNSQSILKATLSEKEPAICNFDLKSSSS